ncbi:MAG TPA: hypothetical protein PKE21_13650 [Flavobacteriales bacterium]|nr:hypothetical protein [Flavobacteriales bacterium]HMR28521.1 hypothetical protein [Flavobacteriales bacterium]
MDKLRLVLINMHVHDVCGFLAAYCDAHSAPAVRINTAGKPIASRVMARMLPLLAARLLYRLRKTSLIIKNEYRLHVPTEEALALLAVYAMHMTKDDMRRWPGVLVVCGHIDQATA